MHHKNNYFAALRLKLIFQASGGVAPGQIAAAPLVLPADSPRMFIALDLIKRFSSWIPGRVAEIFFDTQKLVVLRDTVRPAKASGFDLARIRGNREVGNKRIFGFARPM